MGSILSTHGKKNSPSPRNTTHPILALAHRRIPTLHAMNRNHTLYTPQPATKLPTAA